MSKIPAYPAILVPDPDDVLYLVHDPAGTPISKKITAADLLAYAEMAYNNDPADMLLHCRYNGLLPYETNFTGNPNGTKGQIGTPTGGVIYRPGKFGKAVQVAEAAVNLITDPIFGGAGWYFSGDGDGAMSQSTTNVRYGLYSKKISSTTGSISSCRKDFDFSASTTYTVSAEVYIESWGGSWMRLFVWDGVGQVYADIDTSKLNQWQTVLFTFTTAAGGNGYVDIRFGPPGVVYVGCVDLVESSYRTPHIDGSLGAGHTWSGTPHTSTSSREAASLTYDIAPNKAEGSVSFWYIPNSEGFDFYDTGPTLFYWVSLGDDSLDAYFSADGSNACLEFDCGEDYVYSTEFPLPPKDVPIHFVFTWGLAGLFIYKDGVDITDGAQAYVPIVADLHELEIGTWSGTYWVDGLIDDLCIFNRALTADEVLLRYNLGMAGYS